ncbi:MAG: PspC domain-containing protein [Anaerolineae bacterium]
MIRSWQDRLLGGVCGGLGERLLLSAWVWRLLFIILTVISGGWAALVYVLWWWLLPLDVPARRGSALLGTLLALAAAAVVLGGYFTRDQWIAPNGANLYVPLMALLTASVFLYRQVAQRAGAMIVVALVLVGVALATVLAAQGVLPRGTDDLMARSAGGVLVFLGLALILRDRLPLGAVFALIVTVALVGGLASVAYSMRLTQQRSENVIENRFPIAESVTLLQMNLTALDTDVRVVAAGDDERSVRLRFVGSLANEIDQAYDEADLIATLTLTETRGEGFPPLRDIGRGALTVEVPRGLGVAIAFRGVNGAVTFDMAQANLERLDLDLENGSAVVTFPNYQPLSPSVAVRPGELIVRNGTLTLVAPPPIGGQFLISKATNQRPIFDDLIYALEDNLNEWLLTARQFESSPARIRYILTVPNAPIRLDTASARS